MKRTALLMTAALLTSPAFAATDLCSVNLQKLNDAIATNTAIGEPLRQQVQELRMKAERAQQLGDTEACVNATTLALQRLQQPGTEGGAGESS
ncbi:hypothetical protein FXN65_23890 [Metapseudomonas lalkuanensis]|uniref:DUF1090 family protein n=1 Tax=Metapseudomonas lalkuanensis TaxID=2604832 RepID=A0A5J6QR38_9GAMM|nr:hypothetical protein [Pseudomonas lalkuanensis]QEY64954.1 hypothetical protein FXN65_23890 [Pseudomonas lalkuanensis]UCO97508.1 hypothetical protein LF844_23050 [Pseudomonas lalkuanensis]